MHLIQRYKYELILAIILIGFTAFQWSALFLPYFWDELAYYAQASLYLKREGVFYGQCSELCGANHGFMPIVVEGVSLEDYVSWVSNKLEDI